MRNFWLSDTCLGRIRSDVALRRATWVAIGFVDVAGLGPITSSFQMRISKVGSSKQSAATKKKKSMAKAGEFAERVRGTAGASAVDSPQAVEGTAPVGGVESILAVQEVPDATDGRSRGLLKQYGDDLLDRLDEFRLAILTGTISKDRLTELAKKLRQKRQDSDDPRLNEIIDEIELRAEVEVAKLTRDPKGGF